MPDTTPPTPGATATAAALAAPLQLRSGLVLPNRLVKAAMTEGLADRDGNPSGWHERLYRRWGASGLGAMVTGNAMVDRRYLERARNVVVDPLADDAALRRWAAACSEIPSLVQLNHPGRQCNRLSAWRPVGPSAGENVHVLGMFGRPRALSTAAVEDVRDRFAHAARRVVDAGFRGVQVHAAHGYLLSQFLSAATNRRTDRYGGSLSGRARLLLETCEAVRTALPDHASVWVKVNSRDFRAGGFDEQEAAQVVRWLDESGVDVVELSGGTYEAVAFLEDDPEDTAAFFLDFARGVVGEVEVPLMVTGGFHDAAGMARALDDGVDLIGLARPLAADFDLAGRLLDGTTTRAPRPAPHLTGPLEDASRVGWYRLQMELVARDRDLWASVPPTIAALDYTVRGLLLQVAHAPRRLLRIRQLLGADATRPPVAGVGGRVDHP